MKALFQLRRATAAALMLTCVPAASLADEAPGWADTAELSYVVTAGNAESNALGFKNNLVRSWDSSSFTLKAGGIRVETTTTARTATVVDVNNPPFQFIIDSTDDTQLTAENYFLNGRYDKKITERFFWYTGAGWDRNEFAGIRNRYAGAGGVGNIWYDVENLKFRTDYALTYTRQDDLIEVLGADESYVGARVSWGYLNKFGQAAEYINDLALDANLEDGDDWRAEMVNSVAGTLTNKLALKVSLQWLYDNEPSFTAVLAEALDSMGQPVAAPPSVPIQLDELDTIFTTSLVVKF